MTAGRAGGAAQKPAQRVDPAHPRARSPPAPRADKTPPPERARRVSKANRQDQDVTRYATFDDLLAYCALSADPVGHIVLHVFDAATPDRLALSDKVCTALQIIEHCQGPGPHVRGCYVVDLLLGKQ